MLKFLCFIAHRFDFSFRNLLSIILDFNEQISDFFNGSQLAKM